MPRRRWNVVKLLVCAWCCSGVTARYLLDEMRAPELPTLDAHEAHPPAKPCWVFTHMQKSGGSTIKAIIKQRWSDEESDLFNAIDWKQGQSYTDQYVEAFVNGRSWDLVYGSTTEGMKISPAFRHTCKWFTVFRHPIPRLVSAYFYCKSHAHDNLCGYKVLRTEDTDLLTFARHWGNYGLRQFAFGRISANVLFESFANGTLSAPSGVSWKSTYCWYLVKLYFAQIFAGTDSGGERDGGMGHILGPTQDVIRRDYAAIGILEDFDTTIDLFNAALQLPDFDWREHFQESGVRNRDTKVKEDETEEALQFAWNSSELQSYIRLDIQLYETAVEVFRQQASSYGLHPSYR